MKKYNQVRQNGFLQNLSLGLGKTSNRKIQILVPNFRGRAVPDNVSAESYTGVKVYSQTKQR